METLVAKPPMEKVEDLLSQEIARSRESREPISRVTLARILHQQLGFSVKEAEAMVDRYCEEKDPAVPAYLSDEFGRPYLKVLAFVNVALSIGSFSVAVFFTAPTRPTWPGYALGTLFLVAAVFCWVNSLRPAKKKGRRRRR
jgi:hypothetical protein